MSNRLTYGSTDCGVVLAGKVVGNEDAEELEGVDPLHTLAVNVEGSEVGSIPPEVYDDLFGFCGVQCQVVH